MAEQPERPSQQPSGAAKAAVVAQRTTTPAPGATMADVSTEPQPVPEGGSTVMHPPLPQAAGGPPAEPDESTAEDHEKANSKTEGDDKKASAAARSSNVETITVESALDEKRVALYERDPAHPNGEAFVGPDEQVEVARTGAVEARLQAGILREAGSTK